MPTLGPKDLTKRSSRCDTAEPHRFLIPGDHALTFACVKGGEVIAVATPKTPRKVERMSHAVAELESITALGQ